MRKRVIGAIAVVALGAMLAGCNQLDSAQQDEQDVVNNSYALLLKVLPPPVFTWAFERYVYIKIYQARQHAVTTYSYELSSYTGKIIWGCPSMGYPIPGATQLTNPDQIGGGVASPSTGNVVLPQPEQNGLFSPAQEDATWVSCVDSNGNITPVYDEAKMRAFPYPMEDNPNGFGVIPVPGAKASYSIPLSIPQNIDASPAAPPAQN